MSKITNTEILADIIEMFKNNDNLPGAAGVDIVFDTMLTDDIGIDSLRLVQIMVDIEDKYDIVFEIEDLDPRYIVNMNDLVNVTLKTINNKGE